MKPLGLGRDFQLSLYKPVCCLRLYLNRFPDDLQRQQSVVSVACECVCVCVYPYTCMYVCFCLSFCKGELRRLLAHRQSAKCISAYASKFAMFFFFFCKTHTLFSAGSVTVNRLGISASYMYAACFVSISSRMCNASKLICIGRGDIA